MAEFAVEKSPHRPIERRITIAIVATTVLLGLVVAWRAVHHPRTDDAEIFANYIGMAPQVDGPLVQLNVHDNEFVPKGTLLFVIDPRPYEYAYEKALSDQAALQGQIADEQRRIAAEVSGVSVAKAGVQTAEADVAHWAAAQDQARADIANAEQGVARAKAEWNYANDNLHRIEPLLKKQFVTVDQVDRAHTLEEAQAQALMQAQSQLTAAQAELRSTTAQYLQSKAALQQHLAQHAQAQHSVLTLEPLLNQRGALAAEVKNAKYNLDNCRVYAPFDARVTNLTISVGDYAHIGQQVFTLIDVRTWWAVANFREGQLRHIHPGMKADVFIMSRPNEPFSGVVDSIGFGVTPDEDVVGRLGPGLPDVQRTLNWVHLAARYPVRVRILNPPRGVFRIGETTVVTIKGR
ncbi:MAG TPA: efflux RND transporter periplasmic adaptor subunit [Acidobacteriaceae bacterium]|nr:efflux RND transporter periplasmic adaptor subunit [Acidobacteriaceae bacterium]